MPKPPIIAYPTPWQDVIVVCRKCTKKLDGGFGPGNELTLPRALKQSLRAAGRRHTTRVIETKCLGICPKNAVTVLSASAPASLYTVQTGTDASAILATLLPPPTP